MTVSNSPSPSRVYIRLCKHGKRFLLRKQIVKQYIRVLEIKVTRGGLLQKDKSANVIKDVNIVHRGVR